MRLMLSLFLMLIILFAVALLLIFLPLPRPFPPAMSSERNLFSAIAIGALGMVLLVWFTMTLIGGIIKTRNTLDPVFDELGFTKSSYLVVGRSYLGEVDGYKISANVFPPYRVEPGKVEIIIHSRFDTEMAIMKGKPLIYCKNCRRIDEDFGINAHVYSTKEAKARQLLKSSEARSAVSSMFDGDFRLLDLDFTPSFFSILIRTYNLGTAQFAEVFDNAILLTKLFTQN